jgi:hypothetical protein
MTELVREKVAMTDFLMSQLFGLNGLVNLSNLVFLVAFFRS